jgi:hypothetical protein
LPLITQRWQHERFQTLARFGLAIHLTLGKLEDYPLERLPFGWYSDWKYNPSAPRPNGAEYVQMIPVDSMRYPPNWDKVREAILANPGSLWIIGNEPECIYQGNRSPEAYAEIYHDSYQFIKNADPFSSVAIGGVVQPTPLRLEWLERVLQHYEMRYGQSMPVDVWNIHNQILQEKRGYYGCDIPVGLEADEGRLYQWWQNDSIEIFREHVWAFRRWMAEHGQRDKMLIISEYGVLYPSHWFDTLGPPGGDARVNSFMAETFDFMLHARDEELGCPADGKLLVQRWLWFSLNNPTWLQNSEWGFNGNLCDPYTQQMTVFGEHYERTMQRILQQPTSGYQMDWSATQVCWTQVDPRRQGQFEALGS